MTESVSIPLRGWLVRLARLWSLQPCSPNRLMRPSDRIESAVRVITAIAVLIAVPIAGALGTEAYTDTSAEIRTEKSTKSLVHAVIMDEPVKVAAHRYEARARWSEAGYTGNAVVPVEATMHRGDRVDLWLDTAGAPTTRPRHPDAAVVTGIGVGVCVLVGVWLCGWCLVNGTALLLGRRRSARWDREWRQLCRAIREDTQ
ncbi:hypothetical protein IU479_33860 [Nocardia abscessus]|uniref:Rv1733c family protein n=1 Tax=Nocardia TaxID=1817 RepID=UPI001893D562|nr:MULTISPECIES: hypothetical protein [Nocardia]MBF6223069.1 hypothetical protein [Nocardia abscessus]MDE1673885.1 hypothetical protein [Nocardia gipuzkoensis]